MNLALVNRTGRPSFLDILPQLDDAGLSPQAFRLYAHLFMRWEKTTPADVHLTGSTLAQEVTFTCHMTGEEVTAALDELLDRAVLEVDSRLLVMLPPNKWETRTKRG